jgi:rare lipoprotein A
LKLSNTFFYLNTISTIFLATGCVSAGRSGILESRKQLSKQSCKKWVKGIASIYADKFEGRKTASGEVFSQALATAAHRTIPFGSLLLVRNEVSKRYIIVQINDRGPFVRKKQKATGKNNFKSRAYARELDLSKFAAQSIGIGSHSGLGSISYCELTKSNFKDLP